MNPFNLFKYVPLSLLRVVARLVARVMNHLPNLSVKRVIDINLQLACPKLNEQNRQALATDILRNQALSSVESVKSWAMPPQWSLNQIRCVYGQDILTNALKDSNGMLAIVPHLGTWEILNTWLNQFDSPTIMYKPIKHKLANDFILQGRQRLNAKLVPTDASGVKAIFKTLKSGGFSIVLPDHVPKPSGGINVPFFGVNTLTSTLAPKLASKTKCTLVGIVCVRSDTSKPHTPNYNVNGSFDIYCTLLDSPLLYSKDLQISTTELNYQMQLMIESHLTHYMWGYKRFKNMPIIKNPYTANKEVLDDYIKNHLNTEND